MARKHDSMWRDSLLTIRHRLWGFEAPAPGMVLPMVEYDRGKAVGLIDYRRADAELPSGPEPYSAFVAFGALRGSDGLDELPFLTARYDDANWSFDLFPHNAAARALVGQQGVPVHWSKVTERTFATMLYRMRGRELPDLSQYGVTWCDSFEAHGMTQIFGGREQWSGSNLSRRRRNWEPFASVPFSWRIPCIDLDFAVIGRDDRVTAVVDYKAVRAERATYAWAHQNFRTLNSFTTPRAEAPLRPVAVPAFVVEYSPEKPQWWLNVHCVNRAANLILVEAVGAVLGNTTVLAQLVVQAEWVSLSEAEWRAVLVYLKNHS